MTDTQPEITEQDEFVELTENEIKVETVNLTFTIRVTGVESLGEAVDVAALNLARNGLNSFHILADEPSSDRSWIVYGGHVADTKVSGAETLAAHLAEEERKDAEEDAEEKKDG